MVSRSFQKPKVYDPALAERPLPLTPRVDSKLQQLRDLGFEEAETVGSSALHGGSISSATGDQRLRELSEQANELRAQVTELQEALVTAKNIEARTTQKLQSFTQVNRSQSALMRGELQKSRRRVAHAQAVSARLKAQAEFFQSHAGNAVRLPPELCGLPTEDDAAEEAAELSQAHFRWENDILQMQAELLGGANSSASAAAHSESLNGKGSKSADSQAAEHRALELENENKRKSQEIERLGHEMEQLRIDFSNKTHDAPPPAKDTVAAATSSSAAIAADLKTHDQEMSRMQQEIEASQKESKDQVKKLKQLATAYKQLEQKSGDMKAQLGSAQSELVLARAELEKPKEPARLLLSASSVERVRKHLESQRTDLADLKASVTADLERRLPQVMQDLVANEVPRLQAIIANAEKHWHDKYMAESLMRRKLHNLVQELKGNIRVYCRIRPLNAREISQATKSCITYPQPDEVLIHNEAMAVRKNFQFNSVFNESSTQVMVFEAMRELITSMLDGFNICIFAYGQTGSGKTYSMQGTREDPGIYRRTLNELFKVAAERASWQVSLSAALIEIYNDEINDLLLAPDQRRKKLQVRQGKDGNCVPDLIVRPVACADEVEELLELGQRHRAVAQTDMNEHSSRSHLLVQVYARMSTPQGKQLSAVMTLVDLAGSERLSRSGATGDRAKEAAHINKSLAALGDVIHARATKNNHIPYRNSTLTHLLQDSLGGDSKTLMLLQISSADDSVEETMCSLQFGQRVNSVEMSASKK